MLKFVSSLCLFQTIKYRFIYTKSFVVYIKHNKYIHISNQLASWPYELIFTQVPKKETALFGANYSHYWYAMMFIRKQNMETKGPRATSLTLVNSFRVHFLPITTFLNSLNMVVWGNDSKRYAGDILPSGKTS